MVPGGQAGFLRLLSAAFLVGAVLAKPLPAQNVDLTSVNVLVKDAATRQPISQAHLTLQFTRPGNPAKLKRPRFLSYSAKTNAQGHYRFSDIPKVTVRLIVTAERHQTFSKEFPIDKDNLVLEVTLKEPQPLL